MKLIKYRHLDCPPFFIGEQKPAYCPYCQSGYIEPDDEIEIRSAQAVIDDALQVAKPPPKELMDERED